jgi:hypothetical protein
MTTRINFVEFLNLRKRNSSIWQLFLIKKLRMMKSFTCYSQKRQEVGKNSKSNHYCLSGKRPLNNIMALLESPHSDDFAIHSVYPHDFLDLVYDVFGSQSIMNSCEDASIYA